MKRDIHFLIFSFVTLFSTLTFAQKEDINLKSKLEAALKNFNGDVGIFVKNLKTNKFVAINADTVFPTASMVKIPIMIGTFDKILKGEVKYDQELTYKDSLDYDDGIVGSLKDGAKLPLNEIMFLMCSVSDNTGSLWLQKIAGGTRINTILDSLGFRNTRVNSRTEGREANRTLYGWGQTSPREMAELLTMIRQKKIFNEAASDRMYRNLGRQFWDAEGLSQIPENIKVGSKNGAVNRSRSEVALVHAPHGEYVYCIITKNQKDESWLRNNEGFELFRKVGALLWDYYEPKSKFKPIEGYEKW
jgi:beta-lactamase class A